MPYYRHTIHDPYAHIPFEERPIVQGRIDPKVYQFFFHGGLAGERGTKCALVNTFFKKFHEACIMNGVSPVWSVDSEAQINEILQRLNFIAPKVKKVKETK